MLDRKWRDEVWEKIEETPEWDIVVIGGGITGAGILREATRMGLHALLVEQRDYAWGTSSRSSKLVHGGLRYIKEGRISLMRTSVHEREQLIEEGPGLIDPLGFLVSIYKGDIPGRLTFTMGLTVYDLLALRWDHEYYSPQAYQMLAPHIAQKNLQGGFRYGDAQTDDARLVFRVIMEAVEDGGLALNYTAATRLVWEESGQVKRPVGAHLVDHVQGREADVKARVVINATGAWADYLRGEVGAAPRIRPLRGSHLLFSHWRLPVAQAISFLHPVDRRSVFIFPWEGASLVGTTDMDHECSLDGEPGISPEEVAYLMAAVEYQFPSQNITLDDVLSSYSGVRPVIGSGKVNPSEESREHVVWEEEGLLTVTGGKLTTFRKIALDALKAVRSRLPDLPALDLHMPVLNRVDLSILDQAGDERLDRLEKSTRRRLVGRYGSDALALLTGAQDGELEIIPGTQYLWADLRWAARAESVVHLDDLLLRRVRLGLLLPKGGADLMPAIRAICQPELGWDDSRWEAEEAAYTRLLAECYSLPAHESIPDWRAMIKKAQAERRKRSQEAQKAVKRSAVASTLLSIAFGLTVWLWRRNTRKHVAA